MKPKIILTVGASCSGKTTWAEKFVRENQEGRWANINRDDIRFDIFNGGVRDWSKYKFNRGNESIVTGIVDEHIYEAKLEKYNIIISDTNLNPKVRKKWKDWADFNGYEYEEKIFCLDWEQTVKRNSQRSGGLSTTVLRSQYEKMIQYVGRKTYTPDTTKPKAFLVDIDGTVADMTNIRKPYDWDKVGQDKPRKHVISMVQGLIESGLQPIFLSGRDGCCVTETYDWIMENIMMWYCQEGGGFPLFMRSPSDSRKDTIVKEELFWEYVANNYNIVACLDDRPCMVNLWNELKIPNVVAVGDQLKEF